MVRNAIIIIYLLVFAAVVYSSDAKNGNIGCLFSESLCSENEEWCFNDVAFGKCLPVYGKINEQDLQRFKFGLHELKLLERQIQRLFLLGYRWSHKYTQCVLQSVLESIKQRTDIDITSCNKELDRDLEGALKAIEGEELEHADKNKLAVIHFNPSDENPHSNYADEVYYPPEEEELVPTHPRLTDTGGMKTTGSKTGKESIFSHKGNAEHSNRKPEFSGPENSVEDVPIYQGSEQDSGFGKVEQDSLPPEDIIEERLKFPPTIPMEYYYDDNSGYEPVEMSENDYDYDLFFHSPYATPPKLSRLFKRIKTRDSDKFGHMGDLENVASDEPIRPINLRVLARLLSDKGPDVNEDEDTIIREILRKTEAHGKRFPEKSVGFFRESPAHPTYRQMEEVNPPIYGVYSPYDLNYQSRILPPPPRTELPELSPPKPEYDENYSPDALHPPYIKSDYDKPKSYESPETSNGHAFHSFDKAGIQPDNYAGSQRILPNGNPYYMEPPYRPYEPGIFDYRHNYPIPYDYDYMYPEGEKYWTHPGDERLDVKKPGPFFKSDNNFAFDYNEDGNFQYRGPWMENVEGNEALLTKLRHNQGAHMPDSKLEDGAVPDLLLTEEGYVDSAARFGGGKESFPKTSHHVSENEGKLSTKPINSQFHKTAGKLDSYVYIFINGKFHSKKEGEQLLYLILYLMEVSSKSVENVSVKENQIMFQLQPNSKNISPVQFAKEIEALRESIKAKTGFEIATAGVGTKGAISAVAYKSGNRQMLAVAAIICGVCAALLVAAGTLFLLRRQSYSKAKQLQTLNSRDIEASKDYQDLCRARMAGKTDGKESGAPQSTHGHRVSSLSKETEPGNRSPSSRSSTSSWTEEPVISNMDISTGHMVLSYMEDHLKNKDRLEQEWVALCAYEAEPCSAGIARRPENMQKNRYPDNLPYDHNRVNLNEHANVSGSSYINASSITDHDPRNPAYIATQGPLAGTAADFWQMVWEQGSVVIVMLTRLTENGHALCHRYWPEEGSNLYHIYEVHLVSEHIWCDDYLVRSFYLKNVRSGETRTVTQFHFLSWPESGIPASTKALLEFRRKVNKSYRGRSCPIIVHCSDGVGRSGTYCLIDMVLNRMSKGTKEIDIAATLEHIRDQRPDMVKTKTQFEFVLMAVAEEVHAILKALPQ